ncbi:hypothetical protein [Paenibacillus sp. YSY-4.3]
MSKPWRIQAMAVLLIFLGIMLSGCSMAKSNSAKDGNESYKVRQPIVRYAGEPIRCRNYPEDYGAGEGRQHHFAAYAG